MQTWNSGWGGWNLCCSVWSIMKSFVLGSDLMNVEAWFSVNKMFMEDQSRSNQELIHNDNSGKDQEGTDAINIWRKERVTKLSKSKEGPGRHEWPGNCMCRTKNEEPDPMGHNEENYSYEGMCLWVEVWVAQKFDSSWRSQMLPTPRISICLWELKSSHPHTMGGLAIFGHELSKP